MSQETTFDERRVLHELEQLQLAIRATRAHRDRVQAEFDAQLRAFDPPGPAHVASRIQPTAPAVPRPPADRPENTAPRPLQPVADRTPERTVESIAEAEPITVDALAPSRSSVRLLAAMGGVVLVASLAAFWMFNRAPGPAPQLAAPQQAQPTRSDPPLPEVRKPVASPVDPHVVQIDIKTLRRVWLRVSVDGRIAIEREVAAGEQLPFGADRTIVVRAGDAGAITVRVGDIDQGTMGKDGEVVTRTFTPPGR